MEHTFLVDPIGQLPEKNGLLQKVVLFNQLGRFNRSISFHTFFWVFHLAPGPSRYISSLFQSYGKW